MDSARDQDPAAHWDTLHVQERFRPVYPSEVVVRFLSRFRPALRAGARFRGLDIGVGGGRHTRLLCDQGFDTAGIDISTEGLERTRELLGELGHHPDLRKGSMTDLPFADGAFDVAISYGVYYYGTAADNGRAIDELRRVLKVGGQAFVVQRTCDDYRYGKGETLEPDTFRLTIAETNEEGTVQHFLSEESLRTAFAAFSRVAYEKTETTFADRTAKNSDWLITVMK